VQTCTHNLLLYDIKEGTWRAKESRSDVILVNERHPWLLQILGGADLFLQGVVLADGGMPQFVEGDLMAIKVAGNPFPFAVGTMEVSSDVAARTGEPSTSGFGRGVYRMSQWSEATFGCGS
jgi:hypothetical protein